VIIDSSVDFMNTQQYCKYCGAPADADALYCSSCGKNITPQLLQGTITGAKANTSEVSVPSPVGADITLSQKLNSPGAVASILLGIVALFFTLLAFYFAAGSGGVISAMFGIAAGAAWFGAFFEARERVVSGIIRGVAAFLFTAFALFIASATTDNGELILFVGIVAGVLWGVTFKYWEKLG
jgi:hypothetical protein